MSILTAAVSLIKPRAKVNTPKQGLNQRQRISAKQVNSTSAKLIRKAKSLGAAVANKVKIARPKVAIDLHAKTVKGDTNVYAETKKPDVKTRSQILGSEDPLGFNNTAENNLINQSQVTYNFDDAEDPLASYKEPSSAEIQNSILDRWERKATQNEILDRWEEKGKFAKPALKQDIEPGERLIKRSELAEIIKRAKEKQVPAQFQKITHDRQLTNRISNAQANAVLAKLKMAG